MRSRKLVVRVRWILLGIMVIMGILYGLNQWFLYSRYDKSRPEITFVQTMPEVSVNVKKKDLLADVKATDKKDGDITDTVIIESMSKLLENNQRIVTYAAFDRDNHVGKAERRIHYVDYTPPRFSLEEPLCAKSANAELSEILKPLHAEDCIDGDITDEIVVLGTDMISMTTESIEMQYEVQVTNSCGDVAALKLPVKIQLTENNGFLRRASVELTEYLTYVKVGEQVNLDTFIEKAMVDDVEYGVENVQKSSNLDISKPGVYTVTYTITKEENSASTQLIIVVE